MFRFLFSFLARRIGRWLEPTSFFSLSFLGVGLARSPSNLMDSWSCIAYEEALHLRESREVTREPRAKGDPSARGGELQSRAWSFACLGRFARRTKKKERLLVVQAKKGELSFSSAPRGFATHSRALSPLEVESLLAGYLNQYSSAGLIRSLFCINHCSDY